MNKNTMYRDDALLSNIKEINHSLNVIRTITLLVVGASIGTLVYKLVLAYLGS